MVDLAGDVSLETADGFAAGLAFGDAAGEVVAGTGIPAQAGQDNAVERGVGLAVTPAIDSLGRCGCQGGVLGGVDGGVWGGDRGSGKGCLVSGCVP